MTAHRSGNGEGAIRHRSDGSWEGRYYTVDGLLRHRHSVYGHSRKDVATKLRELLGHQDQGFHRPKTIPTLQEFTVTWLQGQRMTLRLSTLRAYECYLKNHVLPYLGSLSLSMIESRHIAALYELLQNKGLSSTTTLHVHEILHKMFRMAQAEGIIMRNVVEFVPRPRRTEVAIRVLTPTEISRLLYASQKYRLHALYVLAATTGMRQGELFALQWSDIDFEHNSLSVIHTLQRDTDGKPFLGLPKTKRSRRRIELSYLAVQTLSLHKVRQQEEQSQFPGIWYNPEFVFTTVVGTPLENGNFLKRSFFPLLETAHLPKIRFHDLRHSAATMMLQNDIHPKIVSEMLGHASIAFTLDTYSHLTPTIQAQAAHLIDSLFEDPV